MRNHFIFLTIFLLFYTTARAQGSASNSTRIIMENTTDSPIRLYTELSPDIKKLDYKSLKKHDTLTLTTSKPFRIIADDKNEYNQSFHTSYILHPNETIYLSKSIVGTKATVLNDSIRNNELNFFYKMQESLGSYEGTMVGPPYTYKPIDFRLNKIQETYAKRLAFFKKYIALKTVSDDFKHYVKSAFYYQQYIDLFSIYTDKDSTISALRGNPNIDEFIKEFNSEGQIKSSIDYYKAVKVMTELTELREHDYLQYIKTIKDKYHEKTVDYLTYSVIYPSLKTAEVALIIEDFLNSSTSSTLKESVRMEYADYIGDNSTIIIDKVNDENQSILLNQKTGEYISWDELVKRTGVKYIDFWASWCTFCISEIKGSQKLKNEYQNKGITFVYISIDELPSAWNKSSERHQIPKVDSYLLINPNETIIRKSFNISSVPRYMTVKKDGTIANPKAARPSDQTIRITFDELLAE